MGDTGVSELNGNGQTRPTKEWLENQVKSCQVAIERNIGALNLCALMLKEKIYCDDTTEEHNGKKEV